MLTQFEEVIFEMTHAVHGGALVYYGYNYIYLLYVKAQLALHK